MSNSFESSTVGSHAAPSLNLGKITAMGTALVLVNIVLMLVLSYTPVADLALILFSNFFTGIATFMITVGGGFWVSNRGIENGSLPLAGVGVSMTQIGYGLFGAAVLTVAPSALRIPALGITAVITALITAVVALVVFKTDHSFANWQKYSWGFFIGGFVAGAAGFFLSTPLLMLAAGLLFFLGFVVDLTYEIWAVKANRYASDLRNAIGIYIAVMGVFIHVLQLVLRVLSILDN